MYSCLHTSTCLYVLVYFYYFYDFFWIIDLLVKANIVSSTFIFVEAPTNFYANLTTKYGTEVRNHLSPWYMHTVTESCIHSIYTHTYTSIQDLYLCNIVSHIDTQHKINAYITYISYF